MGADVAAQTCVALSAQSGQSVRRLRSQETETWRGGRPRRSGGGTTLLQAIAMPASLSSSWKVDALTMLLVHLQFVGGVPRLGRGRRAARAARSPPTTLALRGKSAVRAQLGAHLVQQFEGLAIGLGRSWR